MQAIQYIRWYFHPPIHPQSRHYSHWYRCRQGFPVGCTYRSAEDPTHKYVRRTQSNYFCLLQLFFLLPLTPSSSSWKKANAKNDPLSWTNETSEFYIVRFLDVFRRRKNNLFKLQIMSTSVTFPCFYVTAIGLFRSPRDVIYFLKAGTNSFHTLISKVSSWKVYLEILFDVICFTTDKKLKIRRKTVCKSGQ